MVIESIERKFLRVDTAKKEERKGSRHLTHPRELWGRLSDTVTKSKLPLLTAP